MNRSIIRLAVAACGVTMLAACQDAERAAVEQYFEDMDPVATEMSEMGTQFETMTTLKTDFDTWTAEETQLVKDVDDTIEGLQASAAGIAVPELLKDIHPILLASLTELRGAVAIVLEMTENPSAVTEANADAMVEKATKGEALATEYIQKLESTVGAKYPDLME